MSEWCTGEVGMPRSNLPLSRELFPEPSDCPQGDVSSYRVASEFTFKVYFDAIIKTEMPIDVQSKFK